MPDDLQIALRIRARDETQPAIRSVRRGIRSIADELQRPQTYAVEVGLTFGAIRPLLAERRLRPAHARLGRGLSDATAAARR